MTTERPAIALLGDVMLGRKVAERLAREPAATIWSSELADLLRSSDAVVCNLECCISAGGSRTKRIRGKPFFFRAPPSAVDALTSAGVSAATLANNHALDYETPALLDTLEHLAAASIASTGAGADVRSARLGAVVPAGEVRLGILAATDHPDEFAAGDDAPGVAHADLAAGLPEWMTEELTRLRTEADVVIAFPHWGPNMTSEPAHWQRTRARELVAAGADLVAGHSAHVFHGIEWIGGRPVLYDLGGALDDYAVDSRLRNDLGIAAMWTPGIELELVGLDLQYCETRLARGAAAEWIAVRLERACAPFGTGLERVAEQRFIVTPPA